MWLLFWRKRRNPKMLVDLKVSEFVDRLGAGTPTPGGGSAAALAGTLAAALGGMVCELTLGKAKYEPVRPEMEKAKQALTGYRKDLLALVDRDSEAYDEVSKALKLPKETPAEKAARQQALGRANQFAPFRILAESPGQFALRVLSITPSAPRRACSSTIPIEASCISASRMGVRDTPNRSAKLCSSRRSPGLKCPVTMSCSS
jgi:hypothetical protein